MGIQRTAGVEVLKVINRRWKTLWKTIKKKTALKAILVNLFAAAALISFTDNVSIG